MNQADSAHLISSSVDLKSYNLVKYLYQQFCKISPLQQSFEIYSCEKNLLTINLLNSMNRIGDKLYISLDSEEYLIELISFKADLFKAIIFGEFAEIPKNARGWSPLISFNSIFILKRYFLISISSNWIGRCFSALGVAIDGMRQPSSGVMTTPTRRSPLPAMSRAKLGPPVSMGVRALDLFVTCREGQRLGIFAGSGIGKSNLVAMIAQYADFDLVVIALVGERGREVREFIEDEIGISGLSRSILVVATSDEPSIIRREAPLLAMTISEHFRKIGMRVLLIIDSITRWCTALRDIALAVGELPAVRGYPASVFSEIPKLLERAGPDSDKLTQAKSGQVGTITGIFTVLVDGDDHNEPISDTIRGILDGHVILDRKIAENGRYPAVNILRSLSRSFLGCHTPDVTSMIIKARKYLSIRSEMTDLINVGAYQSGKDPEIDASIIISQKIEKFLTQDKLTQSRIADSIEKLKDIISSK